MDVSRFPVVTYVAPPEATDEIMFECMHEMDELRQNAKPFALVLDLSTTKNMSAKHRKMLTDNMAKHEAEMKQLCRGTGMVFTSAVLRGVLTAIFWVKKPAYPTQVFATREAAFEWCAAQMRERAA